MRICLLSDFFLPQYGGVPYHVLWLARSLRKRGHKVTVVTTTPGPSREDGIPVVRLRGAGVTSSLLFRQRRIAQVLAEVLENLSPDVAHAHHAFSTLGTVTPLAAREVSVPSVLTNHSIPMGYMPLKSFWRVMSHLGSQTIYKSLRHYDAIIAVSPVAAEYISDYVAGFRGRIRIIPNGIDLDEFERAGEGRREEFGLDDEDFVVLQVGRADIRKGFELGILVTSLLKRLVPRIRLVIVGARAFHDVLSDLSRALGVEDNVRLMGFLKRDKLIRLYKCADVLLHPCYGGESFGIVFLEAMAAGIPIVSAGGDGLYWLVKRLNVGLYYERLSPLQIARGLLRLYRDESLRRRLGERGRRLVRIFSMERIAEKVEFVYREVIEQHEEAR